MNHIDLSFCIPTYNRAESVHRLVTTILTCTDPNIEVVVLDNGSPDATLDALRTIKDERLVVYSNGENKGALFNMVNVLNKGRGKFLVYSTDQDHIDSTKIDEFKTFLLRNPSVAGGYCVFDSPTGERCEIFPKGYQAVKNIAYQGRHPTGYFFNNDLLKTIKLVERFSDYEFVDLFPLEFAFAELCLLGDGAIYRRPIFRPETGQITVAKHKSSTTNGKSKKAFFSPETRLKLAIGYAKHIDSLQLAAKEKHALIVDTFLHELAMATKGYKSILANEILCAHYYMECRKVTVKELVNIGLAFYQGFVKETKQVVGGNFAQQMNFILHVFLKILKKIFWRVIAKSAVLDSHKKMN